MTTTERKYLSKPTKIGDLPVRDRMGPQILTVHVKNLPADPDVLRLFADILEKLPSERFASDVDYSGATTFYARLDDVKADEALREAQENWELSRKQYEACLVSRTVPESGVKYAVERFCRAEALDVPWEMS